MKEHLHSPIFTLFIFLLFLLSGRSHDLFCQSAFPVVENHQKLSTNMGLEDRVVFHVDRNKNGIYLFASEKLQIYTGQKFINESIIIPELIELTDQYLISESLDVYDLDGQLIQSNAFENDVLGVYKEEDKLKVLEVDSSVYNFYEWEDEVWQLNASFENNEDIKAATHLDNFLLYINSKGELKESKNNTVLVEANKLKPQTNPNVSFLKKVGDYCYLSFEGYKGIYRVDKDLKIELLDKENVIQNIYQDDNGKCLLLGRDRQRIVESAFLIFSNGEVRNWHELLNYSDIITDVYSEDFLESLMVSTYNGIELIRFVNQKSFISKSFEGVKDNRGFGRVVTDFCEDSNQNVFSISEVGAILFGKEDNNKSFQLDTGGYAVRFCNYDLESENIWIGIDNFGGNGQLVKFDPLEEAFSFVDTLPSINCVSNFYKETYLIGGAHGSVTKWSNGQLREFPRIKELEDETVRSIYLGDKMLIGTSAGLYLNKGTLDSLDLTAIHSNLIYNSVRTIERIEDRYYIGTYGSGLFILDDALEIIKHVDNACCSLNDYVYFVEVDKNQNYWVGTNNGLFVLDESGDIKDRLSVDDGLTHIEFNTQASHRSNDGRFYFGTLNGVTIVDPDLYKEQKVDDYFVNEILAFKGKDIFYGSSNFDTYEFSNRLDSIVMMTEPCGYQDFYYKYVSRNNFEYSGDSRVELDKNMVTLFKPSYGEHLVYINGKDKNPVKITIKRDYLQVFTSLCVFLLSSFILGYLLYKYLENRSKKKLEESELRIQLAQIKLEALRSQLNPHFIFNSLGAIGYYIQTKESRTANNYLTKFAKLIRAFLESSKNEFISVLEEIQLITYYLELEKMRFVDAFSYEITCDPEVDKSHDTLPTMMIQPFIENSIIHGISHRKDKEGFIKIHFECKGPALVCTIDDNGVGREKSSELKNMSLKKHKSRAMEIISDRIKYSEMSNEVILSVDIKDKYENEKPTGTTVVITITNIESL